MKKLLQVLALTALICVPWVTQAQTALPVTMDFESGLGSWTYVFDENRDESNQYESGLQAMGHGGGNGFVFYNMEPESDDAYYTQYLISPELTGTANGVNVSFELSNANGLTWDYTYFKIGYSTTTNEIDDFTFGDDIEYLDEEGEFAEWETYETTLPAGTKYFAIQVVYGDITLYIDNISLTAVAGSSTVFPWAMDFEGDVSCWEFANNATNGWAIGTAKSENGDKGLYISNDGGTSYARTSNKTASYAYTTLTLSTAADYEISYNWTANGESNYDYIRVWLAPADVTLTEDQLPNGTAVTSSSVCSGYTSTTPEGWIDLGDGKLNLQTSWQTKTKTFSVTDDGNYKLIFMWIQDDGSNEPAAIDNIVINAYTCKSFTVNQPTNVTTSGARISWTDANNDGATYTIKNGEATLANAITPVSDGGNAYHYDLSGVFTAGETYSNLTVTANCGSDHSSAIAVPTFKTPCNPTSLPYENNFDDMTTGNVPDCWTMVGTHTSAVYGSDAYSGSKCIRFYNGSGTTAIMVAPPLSVEANTTQVQFYVKAGGTSSYYGNFYVGYMTDASDAETFTSVKTMSAADYSSYTLVKVPMTSIPDGAAIAFKLVAGSTYGYGWYIDDVTIDEAPNCIEVSNVTVPNVTANTATLNWIDNNSGTATYTIKHGDDVVETTAAGATTYTLTGLTANTPYTAGTYTIVANCEGSPAANVPAFTTACENAAIGTTWNFESMTTSAVPECWYKPTTSSNITVTSSTSYSHNSSKYLDFRGSTSNLIVLPATEDEINTLQVRFWTRPENAGSSSCGSFSVGYVTNMSDASTFVAIATYNYNDFEGNSSSNTQYAEKTVVLSAAPEGARIAMRHNSGSTSYYWFVDDVTIETPPTCVKPTLSANASSITNSGATVSWTPDGSTTDPANGWEIRYRESGSSDDYITVTAVGSATSKALTDLMANESYEYAVRAHCEGEDYSDWTDAKTFKTLCNSTSLPYVENFDSYNASTYSSAVTPDCWTMSPVPSNYYNGPCVYSGGVSSSRSLYMYSSSTHNYVAILPEMSAATNTLQVRFQYKGYNTYSTNRLEVGYVTDITDTTTFVSLWNVSAQNSSYTEAEVTLESAPVDARIAFRNNTTFGVYIDDITVEAIPTCKTVTAVTAATNVTSSGATLSWTDERNEGATYTIYNKAPEPDTILGTTEAGVTTINLTGLTASTTYNQVVIVANCGSEEHSGEVSVPSFTTQSNACAITGVTVSAPTGVTRGDVDVNDENHSVTITVYYLSSEEMNNLAGTLYKSSNSHIYRYNTTSEDYDIEVYSLAGLKEYLAMNTPYTVRVKAQDPSVYQDWTITLQGEECSTPRNLTFTNVERRAFTANWTNADPEAVNYQVVLSGDELDEEGLAAEEKIAVNGTKTYTFTNLDRETPYHVYVRTNCGNDTYSSWLSGTVTTKGLTFCEDVDIANGTQTNAYLPIYGNWADKNQRSQSIYPASELTELQGKTISALKYYTNRTYTTAPDWVNGTWVVGLAITEQANLSSAWDETVTTEVHNGTITWDGEDKSVTVTLTTPFTYTGGNLLVAFDYPSYEDLDVSASFYGKEVTGASRYAYNTSYTGTGTAQSFLPKFSATYCETNEACPTVATVNVSGISETGATVTWDAATGDYVSGYQVIQSEAELDAAALDAYTGSYVYEGEELTCALTSLNAYTEYYIYVRANCGAPDNTNSTWQSTTFRTLSACGAVSNLAVEQTSKTTVVATWTKTKEAQANNFNYILSTDGYDVATQGEVLNGLPKTGSSYTDLMVELTVNPATHYYLYVQNYCEGEGSSPWMRTDFTTYDAMPAVVNLTTTQITHTAIAATWQKNVAQFADETQWQVAAVEHGETPAAWTIVNDTRHTFLGLTPETSYDLYVRPYQASPVAFGTAAHLDEVTTATMPPACSDPIGEGTSNSYGPICGYYGYERNVYLFTAEDGLTAGNINKIAWNYTSAANVPAKIYLKNTDATALSTDGFVWNTEIADATLVYDATASITAGWKEFDITPFNYTGAGLIVYVASSYGGYGGGQANANYTASGANNHIYIRADGSINDDNAYSTFGTKGIDNQRHNVKFCYAVDPDACRDVTNLTVSNVTTDSAIVSWMPGNTEVNWVYDLLDADRPEPTAPYNFITTPYIIYDGLQTDHDYRFWVRPVIDDEPCGNWQNVAFSTAATCGLPTVLPADGITATTATLHAAHETIGTAEEYSFQYWIDGDENNKQLAPSSVTGSVEITGLTPNTIYWYNAMVTCTGEDGGSRWSEPLSFVTDYQNFTLPYTTDFAADRDKEWRMVNNNDNVDGWYIGEAAGNPARGLYISNNGGNTSTYTGSANNTVFAYAGFNNFEAAKQYTVSFDWICNGENSADYLRAWLVPNDVILTAGTSLPTGAGATSSPSNWIALDGNSKMNLKSEWQHQTSYIKVPTDGAYKLVFMWRSDYSVAHDPAAAIDNVSIVESEKYDITVNVTKDAENAPMGAAPTAKVGVEPLASLTDIYEHTTVTLTAGAANYGYQFVNWTNSHDVTMGAGNYVTITLMSDTVLNANYDSLPFTITAAKALLPNSSEYGGEVAGTATVKFNLPVTLTATPEYGYHLVNWVNDHEEVCGTDEILTVNAYRDSTFTAHFDTNVYNVTVHFDANMGTVEGPATIKHFLNADYVATANTGYHFVNWTDSNSIVLGTSTTLNIAAVSNTIVNANFDTNTYALTVNVAAACEGWGTVDGSNPTAKHFVNYEISATPAAGYHFVQWNDGNTDNPRTVTLTEAKTYTATFDTTHAELAWSADAFTGYSLIDFNNWKPTLTNPHGVEVRYGYEKAPGTTQNLFIDAQTGVIGVDMVPGHIQTQPGVYTVYAVHETSQEYFYDSVAYTLTIEYGVVTSLKKNIDDGGVVSFSDYTTEATLTHFYADEHVMAYIANGNEVAVKAEPATGFHFINWEAGDNVNGYTAFATTEEATYTVPNAAGINLRANFDTITYTLTVVSANETMGSVDGSVAAAKHFKTYQISAEANYGYHFAGWADLASTDPNYMANPRTVTLTKDSIITATFANNQYTVTGESADTTMGNVSGTATVDYLQNVTLTATAKYGYHFTGWSNGATTESITIPAVKDSTVTANFTYNQYTVTVANADPTKGSVSDNATVNYLSNVNLTATPEVGYHFVSWTEDDTVYSTHADTVVKTLSDRTLTAHFAINTYNITVNYESTLGTVTNDDNDNATVDSGYVFENVEHGTKLHFTATVEEGSRFANWSDGNVNVLTNSIEYTVTSTRDLWANFNDAGTYQVTLNYDPQKGSVSGGGAHHADDQVTITATPNDGFHFVRWEDINGTVTTGNSYNFTMPMYDTAFTAVFDTNVYEIAAIAVLDNRAEIGTGLPMGTVTLVGRHMHFLNDVLEATAAHGYTFSGWYSNGTLVSEANPYIFSPESDSVFEARFTVNNYTVSTVSANTVMGSVAATAPVEYLGTVEISATAEYGYHFVHWTEADTVYSRTADTVVLATDNRVLTAVFDFSQYTFVATCDTNMGIVTPDTTTDNYLTVITTTAEAKEGYHFIGWADQVENPVRSDTLKANTVITALFDTNVYNVTVNANPVEGSVEGPATIKHFLSGTYTATATPCYHFVSWTDTNNNVLSTEATYTVEQPTAHVVLNANFELTVYTGDTIVNDVCDSFEWHGYTYYDTPVVAPNYIYKTPNNCDSTVTLHLTVKHSQIVPDEPIIACDSVLWNGTWYYESGAQSDTLTGINGCDSIATVVLTINNSQIVPDAPITSCDSVLWNGTWYYESGAQSDTLTGINGCDSIATVVLTINNSQIVPDAPITSCDSVLWNNTWYYESGAQSDTLTGINGCDSIATVILTINNSQIVPDAPITSCDSVLWNGTWYYESGAQSDTLTGINGCDSIATVILTINLPTDTTIEDTILQNELPYTFNGIVFNGEQSVDIQLTNVTGCDSIIHYTLHVQWNSSNMVDSTICASQLPFVWNGVTFTKAGTQAATLPAADQTDSVVVMTLNLFPQTSGDTTAEACESFVWNGQPYTLSDDYQYNYTDINGCDSVVTLHLTINVPTDTTIEDTILQNELPYTFNGIVFNGDRQVDIQLTNVAGCDSIIHYTLHVQWNSSNMVDSTVCASQLPFVWNGVTFNEAGTQAATLPAADQTDSVVVMTLNLFPQTSGDTTAMACESFVWNGMPFTLSDDYQYNYTDINGCDSVVTLHLTINHSVYDTIEMSVLDSVEWHGEWYYTTGQYNDTLTAATGCDSIVTLDLTVTYRVYHNVTLVSGDATMGSVTPMGVTVVEHDSLFTATATALPGRHFVAWMHGNDTASTEAEYTFAVTEDITLTATFDYDAVTVILGVNDPLMGSVNPEPGTYTLQVGEHVHATASAMEGYHFTGWTILGIDETATSEVVDFVVPAEAAGLTIRVMANFAQNTGIDDVETTDFSVYSTGNKIVVSGAEDKDVYVYDVNGRCLRKQTKAGETVEFTMNASGAYLVKVDNAPAKRVVVVR